MDYVFNLGLVLISVVEKNCVKPFLYMKGLRGRAQDHSCIYQWNESFDAYNLSASQYRPSLIAFSIFYAL